jgi:hypothetical protein
MDVTDLPPFFVPPLKLEFVFKQTVSAMRKLSVSPLLVSVNANYCNQQSFTI